MLEKLEHLLCHFNNMVFKTCSPFSQCMRCVYFNLRTVCEIGTKKMWAKVIPD